MENYDEWDAFFASYDICIEQSVMQGSWFLLFSFFVKLYLSVALPVNHYDSFFW